MVKKVYLWDTPWSIQISLHQMIKDLKDDKMTTPAPHDWRYIADDQKLGGV